MALDRIFDIAASAMNAQSQRLNVVASNLANADSVAGPDGKPYQARQVVFSVESLRDGAKGVSVSDIVEDQRPGKRVYEPKHPMADEQGYITHSNVSVVEEMVNMISASRSYQNNVELVNATKDLLLQTLSLGR